MVSARLFQTIPLLRWESLFFILFFITACQDAKQGTDEVLTRREQKFQELGTLFDEDTFIFGRGSQSSKAGETGIGVNSFLWRAALDSLSFMPLKNVDPFGGVILTDWYTTPENPEQRLKVDVLILDRQLRTDGLKVTVFTQKLIKERWIDQTLSEETNHQLEDIILTRARQLRVQSGK